MTLLRRFLGNRDGLSAVEFALIAPVMIVLYFGTVEIDGLLAVDRRVTAVTNTVADLVAQDNIVTDDEIDAIFEAAAAIMAPYDPDDDIRIVISSVQLDDDGDPVVLWSEGHNIAGRAPGSDAPAPENLLAAGSSVIMAETEFAYTPVSNILEDAVTLGERFFLRPRRSTTVCRQTSGTTC